MVFKPNDQNNGHIHTLVCDNTPSFGREVHLDIPSNSGKGSYQLFFHFLSDKIEGFNEASMKNKVQNDTSPIFTQRRSCLVLNVPTMNYLSF